MLFQAPNYWHISLPIITWSFTLQSPLEMDVQTWHLVIGCLEFLASWILAHIFYLFVSTMVASLSCLFMDRHFHLLIFNTNVFLVGSAPHEKKNSFLTLWHNFPVGSAKPLEETPATTLPVNNLSLHPHGELNIVQCSHLALLHQG